MKWIRTVAREILGLFIDDTAFALQIVLWLALTLIVLPKIEVLPSRWVGPLVFLGLALILAESALRFARKR